MGGQMRVRQFHEGFPIVGPLEEPGVCPTHICPDPDLTPEQPLTDAKRRIKARRTTATDPNGRALWTEALARVEKGWLEGPYQYNEEGSLVTAGGPQLANPAFRFGVQLGGKLRAVGDLKRSQTNGAVAVRTPVNRPTWGRFAAVIRCAQELDTQEGLAMAKADHRGANKQLSTKNNREMLAVAILKGPDSGEIEWFIPQTQLFGATAAVLHYSAVSRVMARIAVRWLKFPFLGYFNDFGIIPPNRQFTRHCAPSQV